MCKFKIIFILLMTVAFCNVTSATINLIYSQNLKRGQLNKIVGKTKPGNTKFPVCSNSFHVLKIHLTFVLISAMFVGFSSGINGVRTTVSASGNGSGKLSGTYKSVNEPSVVEFINFKHTLHKIKLGD